MVISNWKKYLWSLGLQGLMIALATKGLIQSHVTREGMTHGAPCDTGLVACYSLTQRLHDVMIGAVTQLRRAVLRALSLVWWLELQPVTLALRFCRAVLRAVALVWWLELQPVMLELRLCRAVVEGGGRGVMVGAAACHARAQTLPCCAEGGGPGVMVRAAACHARAQTLPCCGGGRWPCCDG